jgi:hypothetical protein
MVRARRAGWRGSLGQQAVALGRKSAQALFPFSFLFFWFNFFRNMYKLLKYIENEIKLIKI